MRPRTIVVAGAIAVAAVIGSSKGLDAYVQHRVKEEANALGLELASRATQVTIINLDPQGGEVFRRYITLWDVTIRAPGTSVTARAERVNITFDGPTAVAVWHAQVETLGDEGELARLASRLKDRAATRHAKGALRVSFLDGTVVTKDPARPASPLEDDLDF